MKGIAHFSIGVAAAACFPAAVQAGAEGSPLYFILGGIFGLLPDTLDFKFYRFFYPHDIEVTPDPNRPDPQMIANSIALAVGRAHQTDEPVAIKLNTIRRGADLWQRYSVQFNVADQSVDVCYGPLVDTGGSPVTSQTPAEFPTARSDLACRIDLDYQSVTVIDIFDGPLFQMWPTTHGSVVPRFIPWHREWSHSFVIALLFALAGAAIWTPLAGAIIFAAHGLHICADQLGFMGSSLLFPFSRRRMPGSGIMHSAQPLCNLFAVWLSCVVIFWGLYRCTGYRLPHFNLVTLCFYALALPAAALAALRRWVRT